MRQLDDIHPGRPLPRRRPARQAPHAGRPLSVDVLGAGRQAALVESVEEMSYHGIPGLAGRVRVRLPDDARIDGIRLGDGRLWLADPHVRPA